MINFLDVLTFTFLFQSLLINSAAIDIHAVSLIGGVDRLSYNAIQDVSRSYRLANNDLTIDASQQMSSAVIDGMISKTYDFGVAVNSLTPAQAAAAPNIHMTPLLLSGFVPCYRIDALGISAPSLILTRSVLAQIYTGDIRWWNDTAITSINPQLTLPKQAITVVVDSGGIQNSVVKRALSSFNSSAFSLSGMTISSMSDYPTSKYFASVIASNGINNLATSVIANDGSIGIAHHSVALSLGVSMASMINKAGTLVSFDTTSLTFAALELGTKPVARTAAAVLTDASGTTAWPITFFSYLFIDVQYSRLSCRARQDLINFLLYVYQSPIAKSVLATRGYSLVPELLMEQLAVIDLLTSQIYCRGSLALPVTVTSHRVFSVTQTLSQISHLFNSLYVDPDAATHVDWSVRTNPSNIILSELVNSETDLALINVETVDPDRYQALIDTGDYLILPFYGQSVSWFVN